MHAIISRVTVTKFERDRGHNRHLCHAYSKVTKNVNYKQGKKLKDHTVVALKSIKNFTTQLKKSFDCTISTHKDILKIRFHLIGINWWEKCTRCVLNYLKPCIDVHVESNGVTHDYMSCPNNVGINSLSSLSDMDHASISPFFSMRCFDCKK